MQARPPITIYRYESFFIREKCNNSIYKHRFKRLSHKDETSQRDDATPPCVKYEYNMKSGILLPT